MRHNQFSSRWHEQLCKTQFTKRFVSLFSLHLIALFSYHLSTPSNGLEGTWRELDVINLEVSLWASNWWEATPSERKVQHLLYEYNIWMTFSRGGHALNAHCFAYLYKEIPVQIVISLTISIAIIISICKVEFTQSIMSADSAAILIAASLGWSSLRENVRRLLAQEF